MHTLPHVQLTHCPKCTPPRRQSLTESESRVSWKAESVSMGKSKREHVGIFYGVARDAKAKAVSRYTGCFFTDPPIKISIRGPSPTQ